jgi:hypothetical protein
MQVNIASRYGIKNYAVPGVDYEFLNGDSTDFRRENLQIRNTYHGVRAVVEGASCRYSARIHVKGYYKVGIYDTAAEAAIAYNKAADILEKNGLRKNFLRNYVEGLSPAAYAEIYSALPVSSKIIHYFSE